MATNNVTVLRTGTGWTVDVTPCNLLADLTIKDFKVIIGGSTVANNADFAKTSQTVLTYSGAALAVNTSVEVRRSTPTVPYQVIQYAQRFSSGDYNTEVDRLYRKMEEYELNGVGAGSLVTVATPVDAAFGIAWDGDTLKPPSRNSVYDDLILRPYNANPAFTGVPTAPTAATATNTTQIATTAYVKNNLVNYATVASPALTGTPTAPTAAVNTNSTQLATTAFTNAEISNRTRVVASRGGTQLATPNGVWTRLIFPTEYRDANGEWNGNDLYTAVIGGGYRFTLNLWFHNITDYVALQLVGSAAFNGMSRIGNFKATTTNEVAVSTSSVFELSTGANYGVEAFVATVAGSPLMTAFSLLTVERLY